MNGRMLVFVILPAAMFFTFGCMGQIYQDASRPDAAVVSHRREWKAYGDLRNMPNAYDGRIDTQAVTADVYENATLTIDLGKQCVFNFIVLDHGIEHQYGFARRVAVLTSMDGENFTYRYSAPGTRRVTTLWLITPVLARYVRLQALQQGDRPWSIAEVYFQ